MKRRMNTEMGPSVGEEESLLVGKSEKVLWEVIISLRIG